MKLEDFLRVYPLRAQSIMWFLGAGASAAAGIPTARHLTWDFKRVLYCSMKRVSLQSCPDLGDPAFRAKLQQFLDSTGNFPSGDSEEEYAFYFERTYPAEADRRRIIDQAVGAGTPSYGHLALGALMRLDRVRILWTANFDRMVEDAAIQVLGTSGRLVTASLGEPEIARDAINEGRWPILVKIHGDFQSRRLKNTPEELRAQDAKLRRAMVDTGRRFGLAVVGYSGRDHSIMDALEEAIDGGHGFPSGLFWFRRTDSPVLPTVTRLIQKASDNGLAAHLIEVETFDELMHDILLLFPDLPDDVRTELNKRRPRVSDAPTHGPDGGWPIVRLNALPIISAPSTCRRLVCKIGGAGEVQDAVNEAGADIVAARRTHGVLAFGSDSAVRRTFDRHGITEFDLHSIETRRLRFDSAELGLMYDALARAIGRERPLVVKRRRSNLIAAVDPNRSNHTSLTKLCEVATPISGSLPNTTLRWSEAVRLGLEYRLDRLWLLLEPTIWFHNQGNEDDATIARAMEFSRKRRTARYNREVNALLAAWGQLLAGGSNDEFELRAFGIGDGVDAVFCVSRHLAFSRRNLGP